MLRRRLSILLVILIAACTKPKMVPEKEQYDAVTVETMKKHLTYIASDEMKGRDTGSPELNIVAEYLAKHLKSYGYKGLNSDTKEEGEFARYYQSVPLKSIAFKNDEIKLSYKGRALKGKFGKDYVAYNWADENLDISTGAVAVSYGLFTDEHKNYEKEDVDGKIAIRFVLNEELKKRQKEDRKYTHQEIRNKLFENGAKAVVLVVPNDDKRIKQYAGFASGKRMNLGEEKNDRSYILMKESMFNKIVRAEKLKRFDSKKKHKFKFKFSIKIDADVENVDTKNVVAVLEGTDSDLKDEYVAYGAHYDHVGVRDGEIYNGADDDGSGTVGILNLAKAIAMNPPRRSTMIIFHTGEEKGLLGSAYYADNPLLPMEKMVCMLNFDMIGSDYEVEKIHVVGADKISQELHDINVKMNDQSGKMELDYTYNDDNHPARIYYRSDHWNYAKNGVPVIFYYNEDPDNYHKPSDTVEKINFEKMVRVVHIGMSTGYYVSNMDRRLKLNEKKEEKSEN